MMSRPLIRSLRLAALAALLMAPACDDDGTAATSLDAAPTPDGGAPAGLALVGSDYMSTVISLLDPTSGAVVKDACLTSGSRQPQLSTALSGDVTLPSAPQPGNELLIIDRKQAALTWVDPRTCAVLRQMNVGEGFKANPHDVIAISPTKAYVTRFDANPANPAQGSDILVIDPSTTTIVKAIGLRAHAAPFDEPTLPNPHRGVLAGGKVYVVLQGFTDGFKKAARGRIVVIDPATDTVTGTIDLPGESCGGIDAVVEGNGLVVSCGGLFSDTATQIKGSAAVWIDLGATPPAVRTVPAATFGRPVTSGSLVAASASRAFAITAGDYKEGGVPDQVWTFDFAGGAPRKIFDGSRAGSLGAALDRGGKRLFVIDASMTAPKVHVFDATMPDAPPTSSNTSATGLPPRDLAWY